MSAVDISEGLELLERAKESWRIIRDYQAGAEYEVSDIRMALVALRDALSKLRVISIHVIVERGSSSRDVRGLATQFSALISSLISSLDTALIGIETLRGMERAWLALALHGVDVELVFDVLDGIFRLSHSSPANF